MQDSFLEAIQDFHRARLLATIEQATARITGKPKDLLDYDEVFSKLHAGNSAYKGVKDIPIDAIIGTMGRYTDFSRSFLPKDNSDQERWAKVFVAQNTPEGLSPIEVYKIGNIYFVKDGHHRVSVARQIGASYIEAHVTEVKTKVLITAETDVKDLILKAEYVDFLEHTHLDELRPEADLTVTVPGQYEKLEEHINVHRYFMGIDQHREISYQDAVTHWYDTVYKEVEDSIDLYQLLQDFPERTKTDLYLWIMENRTRLEESLGWYITPFEAAAYVGDELSNRFVRWIKRSKKVFIDLIIPDSIEPGPPPGEWRTNWLERIGYKNLFHNIMVPLSGTENSWKSLEQAIVLAKLENGRLRGLHVVQNDLLTHSTEANNIQRQFDHRCDEAGVQGNLNIEAGMISRKIIERSRWIDLVVLDLAYPPGIKLLSRLRSGINTIINRCSRPILAVPCEFNSLNKIILAYDGSPKSREALFISAYCAEHWHSEITILTISINGKDKSQTLDQAKLYLDNHHVKANYILDEEGSKIGESIADTILRIAKEQSSRLILIGGYQNNPILHVALSSDVDEVLRKTTLPVLICR